MKQTINIRNMSEQKKIGNYQYVRDQIREDAIKQIKKRAIHSSSSLGEFITMKPLEDQQTK